MLSFFKHCPYSTKPTNEKLIALKGVGAPGEMLSLSFSLSACEDVSELLLTPTELTSSDQVIPAGCIDLFIVKVWEQAGLGVYQSAPVQVAELLLKDDRVPLHDGYSRRGSCGHWKHILRRARLYSPPDIRVNGDAITSVKARESKQIWVSVKIPTETTPGVYSGHIRLQAKHQQAPQYFELQVEVLPIKLLEAGQDLFIWFKGTLNCNRPQHYLTEERFRAQLQDIYDHGFRSISLNEFDPTLLQRAVGIADSIGFNRNALLTATYPARFSRIDFKHLTPIYYISDEMDVRDEASQRDHIQNWHEVKNAGGQTMASLVHQSFSGRMIDKAAIGCHPEILSYYLPANLTYFAAHSEFLRLRERKTYYYWQCHMEKPDLHRVLAGVFLWKSKASGISPYCYQHLPQPPFSAFDDFDEWEPGFHVGSVRRAFKDHMTTYPGRSGSIPTLQWKGLADGIYDLRYLTTLESTIKKYEASNSAEVQEYIRAAWLRVEEFLKRITFTEIDITSETNAIPYPGIRSEEYLNFRRQLARDIVALDSLVNSTKPSQQITNQVSPGLGR